MNNGNSPKKELNASDLDSRIAASSRTKIYYCTRTHSQLQQIVDELRDCHGINSKQPELCLLGSRSHYCINTTIKEKANDPVVPASLDELCNDAREHLECVFAKEPKPYEAAAKILSKDYRVWDIEDAIGNGVNNKVCPYYTVNVIKETAEYFLAPYNYVIDPQIRAAMRLDLKDAIIVFDEAHNIEDVARDAGSMDCKILAFNTVATELGNLAKKNHRFRQWCSPLQDFVNNVLSWIGDIAEVFDTLPAHSPYGGVSMNSVKTPQRSGNRSNPEDITERVWTGHEFLDLLRDRFQFDEHQHNFLKESLSEIEDFEKRTAEDSRENGKDSFKMSTFSMAFLQKLLNVFTYLLGKNRRYAKDYRVVLQREQDSQQFNNRRHQRRKSAGSSTAVVSTVALTFHLWCLSGSVVFEEIFAPARSVIFTSGTLSPLDSFEGEFAIPFPVRLEASHVIDLNKQLVVGLVSTFRGYSFQSTFSCQQSDTYLDVVGEAFLSLIQQTPGGTLLFLPSYSLLFRLKERWTQRQLFTRIDALCNQARVFFEPKDGTVMKDMLEDYYDCLSRPNSRAAMVAVCRGKISEGINFSDHYARTVAVLGIPFPSLADLKVNIKRQYQDEKFNADHVSIDGRTWYKQQALRAINQAIGRCIRHQRDFGAIVLLDPRFAQDNMVLSLSKWMRSEARGYERLEDFLPRLQQFFEQSQDSYHAVEKHNRKRQEVAENKIRRAAGKGAASTLPSGQKARAVAASSSTGKAGTGRDKKHSPVPVKYEEDPDIAIGEEPSGKPVTSTEHHRSLDEMQTPYHLKRSRNDNGDAMRQESDDDECATQILSPTSPATTLRQRDITTPDTTPSTKGTSSNQPSGRRQLNFAAALARAQEQLRLPQEFASPESFHTTEGVLYSPNNSHHSSRWNSAGNSPIKGSSTTPATTSVTANGLEPETAPFDEEEAVAMDLMEVDSNGTNTPILVQSPLRRPHRYPQEDHNKNGGIGTESVSTPSSMTKVRSPITGRSMTAEQRKSSPVSYALMMSGQKVLLSPSVVHIVQSWSFMQNPSPQCSTPKQHDAPSNSNSNSNDHHKNCIQTSEEIEPSSLLWTLPIELRYLAQMFRHGLLLRHWPMGSCSGDLTRRFRARPAPVTTAASSSSAASSDGGEVLVGRLSDYSLSNLVLPMLQRLRQTSQQIQANGHVKLVEEWFAEDQVVYRLLYTRSLDAPPLTQKARNTQQSSLGEESEAGYEQEEVEEDEEYILLAAEVLAGSTEMSHLLGQIVVHPALAAYANPQRLLEAREE